MFSIHSKRFAGRTAALALASSLLLTNVVMLGGCASKNSLKGLTVDKVIKTLEKKFDAEEYDDELDSFDFYDSADCDYITGEGKEEVEIMNFCGAVRGSANTVYNYNELRFLKNYVTDNDCEYVVFRKYEPDEGINYASSVITVFIEFEDDDDAMDCFDDIMENAFFAEKSSSLYSTAAYERVLDQAENARDRLEGTILGDYISENTEDQDVVELDDLTKDNYVRENKMARFDFNLLWKVTKYGDVGMAHPDDENVLDQVGREMEGVMGHHLCVDGNKLLLICGFNFDKSKGEAELVTEMCKYLSTGNPFDVKMDDDLKKYLLYLYSKWAPGSSRLEKF